MCIDYCVDARECASEISSAYMMEMTIMMTLTNTSYMQELQWAHFAVLIMPHANKSKPRLRGHPDTYKRCKTRLDALPTLWLLSVSTLTFDSRSKTGYISFVGQASDPSR